MIFLSLDASGFSVFVGDSFVDISELNVVTVVVFVNCVSWTSSIKYNQEIRLICTSVASQKYSCHYELMCTFPGHNKSFGVERIIRYERNGYNATSNCQTKWTEMTTPMHGFIATRFCLFYLK